MNIRRATVGDTKRLLEIYAYYVENTAISFEYTAPSFDEFQARIADTLKKYPYLVLEADGAIKGYAYAGAFKTRAAYQYSCETSIYLDHTERGKGCGRLLYEALEKELKDIGILNLYACVTTPTVEDEYLTRNSERFHRHMGYRKVGECLQCGYKFNRWYNMTWMEKLIGEHV